MPAPPSLVIGIGASRGAPVDEIVGLIRDTLRAAGLFPLEVRELATANAKADEPGIVAAAALLGIPLRSYTAAALACVEVPHPSGVALAAVGTPSVAEAAALAAGGVLLVPKRKSCPVGRPAQVTCAVARSGPGPAPEPGAGAASRAAVPDVTRRADAVPECGPPPPVASHGVRGA